MRSSAVCGLISWNGHNRELLLVSDLTWNRFMLKSIGRSPVNTYSGLPAQHWLKCVESVDHLIHTLLKSNYSQSQLFVNSDRIFLRVKPLTATTRATITPDVNGSVVMSGRKTWFYGLINDRQTDTVLNTSNISISVRWNTSIDRLIWGWHLSARIRTVAAAERHYVFDWELSAVSFDYWYVSVLVM